MSEPPNLRHEPTCINCKHHKYEHARPKTLSYCKKHNYRMKYGIYICDDMELKRKESLYIEEIEQ